MRVTRPWLNAARTWYHLNRHDEEGGDPPATDPPESDDQPEESDPPKPETGETEPPAKPATDWKARSREWERRAKANAAAAKRLEEIEAANQTEAEKLAARAEKAEKAAQKAADRAVAAEVKALASDQFADPSDTALLGDLRKYVGDDGEIDTEAIQTDLAELLERKPHLRKQAPAPNDPPKPKTPKPDPSQGSGRGGDKPIDFRTASKDDFEAELAKYGARLR